MPKKIFDIFPPAKPPTTFREEKEKPFLERVVPPSLPKKRKWWGRMAGGILVFLIIASIFCHFVLAKAEIQIWPETEILKFRERVTVNSKIEKVDPALWLKGGVIPAKIFETDKTVSQEFLASGKKGKQAEGTIRVYNAYSTSPQVFVAETRFVSADGKVFRAPVRVTIPGGYYEKGKFIPGFIDIKVKADQPGEDYNIGPTTFSIPGLAGTARYTAFYGKSFESMSGGGEVLQVSKEDLENAEKILTAKTLKESKISLKSKINSDFVLLDEALLQEIIETTSTAEVGSESQSFNFQVKVKSQAIAFKKSDLENFAREFIISQTPADKKFIAESLEMNYWPESIDLDSEKMVLNLALIAKIYSPLDETSLKSGFQGKSLKEAQILLENQPEIKKFQINFFPFWQNKIPENPEKIKIRLNLD